MIRSSVMSIEWAGLGPELLLGLDRRSLSRSATNSARACVTQIRSSRLRAGERLPSSRVFPSSSVFHGARAGLYAQLEAEGFLTTQVGAANPRGGRCTHPAHKCCTGRPSARLAVDFRSGVPDLASFPSARLVVGDGVRQPNHV